MLNGDKTLFTVSGTPQQLATIGPIQFQVGDATVSFQKKVINLGAILTRISTSSHLHILPISGHITSYIT